MNEPQHNPYSPPKAAVDDVGSGPLMERPRSVVLAMKLLLVSLALSFVTVALDWEEVATGGLPMLVVVVFIVMTALAVLIYHGIWVGRNWARIVLLVLAVISLPMMLLELQSTAQRAPVVAGINLITTFVDFFALYLLFFPGREWFRKRS